MKTGELGKTYQDGEAIIRQGEPGDRMYVIQSGCAAVIAQIGGKEIHIANLNAGDIFGEMALFDKEVRSATVRAVGEARLLSIDRQGFLRRVNEDPSLAYRILQQMSARLRKMNTEISQLKREVRAVLQERRAFKERRTIDRRRSTQQEAVSEKRASKDRRDRNERRKRYSSLADF